MWQKNQLIFAATTTNEVVARCIASETEISLSRWVSDISPIFLHAQNTVGYLLYERHYKPQLVFFFTPFFTVDNIVEWCILQSFFVFNPKGCGGGGA